MSEPLISKRSVNALIEYFHGTTLAEINRAFMGNDIGEREDHQSPFGTQRKALTDRYIASLDLTQPADARRLLAVFHEVLSHLEIRVVELESIDSDASWAKKGIAILLYALRADGYDWKDGRFVSTRSTTSAVTSETTGLSSDPLPFTPPDPPPPATQAANMDEEERAKLDRRLASIGIDRLLADQAHSFANTVGGPASHRVYAGDWLSDAIETRRRTDQLLAQGRDALRTYVLKALYDLTEGEPDSPRWWIDLAKEIKVDLDEVERALGRLEREGRVEQEHAGWYAVTLETARVFETMEREAKEANGQASGKGVFIGHGRSPLYHQVASYLRDEFGVEVQTFERHGMAGEQVIPTLQKLMGESGFAVIVATGEDESAEGLRARQNVVHETGLFQGRLGFERVAILMQNGIQTYTNLSGLLWIPFDGDRIEQTFTALGKALRNAGYKHA